MCVCEVVWGACVKEPLASILENNHDNSCMYVDKKYIKRIDVETTKQRPLTENSSSCTLLGEIRYKDVMISTTNGVRKRTRRKER